MSNPKKIVGEVIEHLSLYKSLNVRWTAKKEPIVAASAMGTGDPGRVGAPKPSPPSSVIKSAPPARIVMPTGSMFDTLPVEWESLEAIREDLGDCRRCKLAGGRTNIVFGSGNPHAQLMLVGEAPGADEDEQGLPFVGRAGQLLTKILEAIELRRSDVYICNILKCRPPNNRPPESDEIASCEQFLFRQVASIKPKVICALGTFGAQTLLRTKESITRLRGQWFSYRGTRLMATFHPAYLLRNPSEKRRVWEDVQKIRDYLRSSDATEQH